MPSSDASLPDRIGRYRIVRLLGHGAMGRVLLAHDPVLDRDVAIKHLRDDLAILPEQREGLIERMRQEARASARVSHPNIVALHDMGEDPRLGLFLVFEYVDGPTLKDRLAHGPLDPTTAAQIARHLGGALTMAHNAGVLHRDIKPENVMLSRTGAKIADFGIARVPDSTLTSRGGLLGTPAYSAPEAITSGKFNATTDQFSLAATLYEALSGRRAFPGDDAVAVAAKISTEEPPKIAEVCNLDSHVDTVLARGLSKNAGSRFESCEAFGDALSEALVANFRPSLATLPDAFHVQQDQPVPNNSDLGENQIKIVVGGVALAGLAIAALMLFGGSEEEPEARPLPAPLEAETPTVAAGTRIPPTGLERVHDKAVKSRAEDSPPPRNTNGEKPTPDQRAQDERTTTSVKAAASAPKPSAAQVMLDRGDSESAPAATSAAPAPSATGGAPALEEEPAPEPEPEPPAEPESDNDEEL